MKQTLGNSKEGSIYDYDDRIQRTYNLIESEFSRENTDLIKRYDRSMIAESLAKATRHKHLQVVLNLTRFLGKDWKDVTKDDIENVVVRIVQEYCSDSGQETNTSYDHKKILKIFFRWYKFGSRKKEEVGDPQETSKIKIKKVKDTIVREDLITEQDRTALLQACSGNLRDRALIDCHFEAGTVVGSSTTDSQGTFTLQFQVPALPPGTYPVQSSDSSGSAVARSSYSIISQNACTPPSSGDWILSSSCTLSSNVIAPANVIIQTNVMLTVPNGITLTIHFGNYHLLVQPGGEVYVQPNGKISS